MRQVILAAIFVTGLFAFSPLFGGVAGSTNAMAQSSDPCGDGSGPKKPGEGCR
jgi:hypothetical protein